MSKNKFTIDSILNIDSAFRNKSPKNIFKSDNKYLPNNPLYLSKGSSIVSINYPNHNLSNGDNIIIQNVEGISKILAGSVYLINNFDYFVIIFDNQIPNDYKNYTDELFINIELIGNQTENNYINNIQFNYLFGYKQCFLLSDIPTYNISSFENVYIDLFETTDINTITQNCLLIKLPQKYIDSQNSFFNVSQTFKITYQHVGGIKLGYLNANYPINNINYQSNYQIYSIIDENNFQINLNYQSFSELYAGGKNIQVMKIINTITGYPDADNYVIDLKKSFNNVVNIELISSEFPYVDIVIKKNVNDKLYWKNIEDGQYIYKIQLDEGFYTVGTLFDKLKVKMNSLPRITNNSITSLYNNFDIEFESNVQKITFKSYNLTKLPNSLSIRLEIIENIKYYILNVNHQNNLVDQNDQIIISNSENVSLKVELNNVITLYSIDSSYINKTHTIYNKNIDNQTYDIILGQENDITTTNTTVESYGGPNILIKSKTKVSFLFDKQDTIGEILGFMNVGDSYSITDFKYSISNTDSYIISNNLDIVGNPYNYSSGFINLSGKFNYILMYLNDIEYIFSNNNLPSAFAKISLSGNSGDVLFNTFIPYPNNVYSKSFPISTLTELTIKFIYPDGSRVNFRNIDHSFTLKITEEKYQNINTHINSNSITFIDEFKKNN